MYNEGLITESEYELLVPQEKVKNYSDWNEIFDMVEAGSSCL